jgi:hypothetical protein
MRRLNSRDWDLIPHELVKEMKRSDDPFVREVGKECAKRRKDRLTEPVQDYALF